MSDTCASTNPDGVENVQVETIVVGGVARVILSGELDFSSLDQLDAALDDVLLEGTRFLQLDVAQLVFADTAAVRRLGAFTAAARQTGHQVETIGANRTFHRVAAVLDVQDDLGLT
jgi:ABC-type transporter Mla MlaB component